MYDILREVGMRTWEEEEGGWHTNESKIIILHIQCTAEPNVILLHIQCTAEPNIVLLHIQCTTEPNILIFITF